MKPDLKVGDTVWVFDQNRRVYADKEPGRLWASGGPIFRGYFVPRTIIGETSVSWLIGSEYKPVKINKKTLVGIYPTQESVDQACWIEANRREIARLVERCDNYELLRKVAAIIGATEQPETPLQVKSG